MGVDVSIEVEGPVRVGERLEATVVVETDRARDVEAITLNLTGVAHIWRDESQHGVRFFEETLELTGPTRLAPGKRRLRAKLELPDDVPPACNAGDLSVVYELHARVDIAWRIDPRALKAVTVLPALAEPRGAPRRVTATSEARAGEPFLELALDDARWAPGETITGAFSVGNVGARRLDGATVAVVTLDDAIALAIPGTVNIFKSLVGVSEGSVIRFALPLPKEALPSFESRIGKVTRAVVLRVDGSYAECVVPIVIDDYEPRAGALQESAEAIGGARWREAWCEEGARYGLSVARAELSLHGALAGGAVQVTITPHGNGLRAKLRWESFGVGLRVKRWSITSLGGFDLANASPAFAKRFDALGRDERQVRAVLDEDLCARLVTFDPVKVDDEGAELGRDVPARDPAALRGFLEAIDGVASAIVAAVDRVPPPAWVDAESAVAWRGFAESTGGRLRTGPMSVRGAIVDGDRVHVETLLGDEEQPTATRVVLVLDPTIEVREPPARPKELTLAARRLMAAEDAHVVRQFDVEPDAITIEVNTYVRDPAALRPIVAEMQRLAARLRGETSRGPYR